LRPYNKCLENEQLDHRPSPPSRLRRLQQPLKKTSPFLLVAAGDEQPRQRNVFELGFGGVHKIV
jgi:hypothetical protein